MKTKRLPAVAGTFYSSRKADLLSDIQRLSPKGQAKKRVLAAVSPHAGYMYSGAVAGLLFSRIAVPGKVIILAPNHTGWGTACSVWSKGSWETPLGEAPIEEALCEKILASSKLFRTDEQAHLREHSAEVQVPFLQYWNPDVRIAPIVMALHRPAQLREVGEALAECVKDTEDVLLVASSDMTHFEPDEDARRKDKLAIDAIIALDPERLWKVVDEHDISMCGVDPAVAMLYYAKKLGASRSELVEYKTSGDASGDYSRVVGYAAITVE